jgi:hypothetical protein
MARYGQQFKERVDDCRGRGANLQGRHALPSIQGGQTVVASFRMAGPAHITWPVSGVRLLPLVDSEPQVGAKKKRIWARGGMSDLYVKCLWKGDQCLNSTTSRLKP